jgi:hypothetical protein
MHVGGDCEHGGRTSPAEPDNTPGPNRAAIPSARG